MTTLTLVTSTFNARDALIKTADSIRAQRARLNIQWIIADGGSSDGTLEIIHANADLIDYWHSQPDHGIYHAWNLLLPHVRGDWIWVLGAGDLIAHDHCVEDLLPILEAMPDSLMWVYAQAQLVGRGMSLVAGVDWATEKKRFYSYMSICHQSVLMRSRAIKQFGPFAEKYRIAGDFEYLLRMVKQGYEPQFIPKLIAVMPADGMSNHPKSALPIARELWLVRKDLAITPLYPWAWWLFAINVSLFTLIYYLFGQSFADKMRKRYILAFDPRARNRPYDHPVNES